MSVINPMWITKITGIWRKFNYLIFPFVAFLMYVRAFYGTELTDEAHYLAEAKCVLNGNIPISYSSSIAIGFTMILLGIQSIYSLLFPYVDEYFLFTRICFISFKILICLITFLIAKKQLKKEYAISLAALMLPVYGFLQNFSYNTVPIFLLYISGIILYDVIELDSNYPIVKILFVGLLSSISFIANPGWGLAIPTFGLLMIFRISRREEKRDYICIYLLGVLSVVFFYMIMITSFTSFRELLYGLYRILINPIPFDPLNSNFMIVDVFKHYYSIILKWIKYFLLFLTVYIIILIELNRIVNINPKTAIIFMTELFFIFYFSYVLYFGNSWRPFEIFGCLGFFFCFYFFFLKFTFKDEPILYYLGVYPFFYTVLAVLFAGYSYDIWRFGNCYTLVFPIYFVLLKNRSKLIRFTANLTVLFLVIATTYTDFRYTFLDSPIWLLKYKVQSGVYKGIYTTKARAHDLPELERYLNHLVGKDEIYAFRDNAPYAYLMTRNGIMCDIGTWDCLQYGRNANSPARLFEYYRRRGMIPQKIIYVKLLGNDNPFSIDDPIFRYNDFVNAYYDLVEDINLNETFRRVKVYQYNGKFDGNYQYWIDTYWQPTKPKRNSLF